MKHYYKSIKLLLVLLFLYCLSQFSFFLYAENETDPFSGIKCLLTAFRSLGVETDLDELKNLSGYDEKKGTTLNELSKAVESKGLYSKVIKISLDNLAKLETPVIIYLLDENFKTIDRFEENKKIRVIAPNEKPLWIDKGTLTNMYSGLALIISKEKSTFPQVEIKGPDIRFEEYVYNFGIVTEGDNVEHIFKFKNVGKKELVIERVRTSCGCTASILSNKNILSGGEGEIKVTFNTNRYQNLVKQNIYVHSNDSVTPLVQLQVKGTIKAGEFQIFPISIKLGNFKKDAAISKEFYVSIPDETNLKILKADTSSNHLFVKIPESSEKNSTKFEMFISTSPDIPFGEFKEKIIVYTNSQKHPEIDIPVTGNIIGDIEVRPSKFFFGLAGEIRESKVTIFTTGKELFNIKSIDNPSDFLSIETIFKIEGKEYELIASLKEGTPLSNIKGNITIYTNNLEQPKIEIPISCLTNTFLLDSN